MSSRRLDIAISGAACRLPGGADDPGALWRLMREKRDAVREIPADRWNRDALYYPAREGATEPGTVYTWSAGVLDDYDQFDASFFGVSPREAENMDPQQRLLLELAWECFENSGVLPSRLAGSLTGVFVGISLNDYSGVRSGDVRSIDPYYITGTALSIASNRVSYIYDLKGPSFSVDTACSSSLVALHLAAQSIAQGESERALVGGVNALLNPFPFLGFSSASMLSPAGRCQSFDADARGYVRSEGGVVLMLEPLEAAQAAGRPVLGVLRATGINSDGRTNGIALPSLQGQRDLLEQVYQRAELDPAKVAYVEAHGTGTPVGDPVELGAIGDFFGPFRTPSSPLTVGSIKSNIGHLEPGAGLAGVLKALLALQHRAVPPNLHFEDPNPNIPFEDLRLRVAEEETPLPADPDLLVGVNSFGFGGANAHAVIQAPPPPEASEAPTEGEGPAPDLRLSARSQAALLETARRWADRLDGVDEAEFRDVAYTALHHRDLHKQRLLVDAASPEDVVERLRTFAQGEACEGLHHGVSLPGQPKVALLFSGNGSQWQGMGADLLDSDPVFAGAVAEVDAFFQAEAGWSVVEQLRRPAEDAALDATEIAQPCLFAIQVGLTARLRAWGVEPAFVVGHSVGEIAAAWASGALSLESAARVIHRRSQTQAKTRGLGRMAAAGMTADAARTLLEERNDGVELACVNSPRSVTLAGPLEALEALRDELEPEGVFYRILDLDYAFHSKVLDPFEDELIAGVPDEPSAEATVPMISSVTGEVLAAEDLCPRYWWANLRETVRFDQALDALAEAGVGVFLEVGPHPILAGYVREVSRARASSSPLAALPTLVRAEDGPKCMASCRGQLFVLADAVDLGQAFPEGGRFVSAPNYPFQRERFWYEPSPDAVQTLGATTEHPLLGQPTAPEATTWETRVDTQLFPFLEDHRVGDTAIFPAAAFIEMALAAGTLRSWNGAKDPASIQCVEDLQIFAPLRFESEHPSRLRLSADPSDGRFTIESREALADGPWTLHVQGRLIGGVTRRHPDPVPFPAEEELDRRTADELYEGTAGIGLNYGPRFQGLEVAFFDGYEAWARLLPAESLEVDPEGYLIHPSLLDSAIHLLVGLADEHIDNKDLAYIPIQFQRIHRYAAGVPAAVKVYLRHIGVQTLVADYQVLAEDGSVLIEMQGCRFRALQITDLEARKLPRYTFRAAPRQRYDHAYQSPCPAPEALAQAAAEALWAGASTPERQRFRELGGPLVDAAVASAAHAALAHAEDPQAHRSLDAWIQALEVEPRMGPLLSTLLQAMARAGVAEKGPDGFALVAEHDLPAFETIWRSLIQELPAYGALWTLLGRSLLHLLPLLRGEVETDELLPDVPGEGLRDVLSELAPAPALLSAAMVEAAAAALDSWPTDRRARVLDLEPRSSRRARALAQRFPDLDLEVVLRTRDPARHAQLELEVSSFPKIRAELAGPEASEALAAPGSFDLALAHDGLHRSADLRGDLADLRQALAPNGCLLVGEQPPDLAQALTFGLDPSWWREAEDGPRSRRSTPSAWKGALEASGFATTTVQTERGDDADPGVYVLVTRRDGEVVDEAPADLAASLPADPAPPSPSRWLLLTDPTPSTQRLADALAQAAPAHVEVVRACSGAAFEAGSQGRFQVRPDQPEDFRALCDQLADGAPVDEVLHLCGLDLDEVDPVAPADLPPRMDARLSAPLHLLQHLSPQASGDRQCWTLVTAGALPPPGGQDFGGRAHQRALVGLGRVLSNERRDRRFRVVDLHGSDLDELAPRLVTEVLAADCEDEVLLTPTARWAMRMQGLEDSAADAATDDEHMALDPTTRGLANLRWRPAPRLEVGPGQVEVEPRAVGLNFRDVMWAMGLLPEEALEDGFAGPNLGLECAGVVTRVGDGVTEVAVGDRVVAYGPGCFAHHVVTAAHAVQPIPAALGFEEAATLTGTFFTAYYSLEHLAQIEEGERVLIHGGAGGVGLAAIQLAMRRGCEVFATAGSPEKRDVLRLLGVDHVLDSRSLEFAEDIHQLTGGEGVDVVLNSLAGEAIQRGLRVLRPFGRFIELGKRDFYADTRIGLRPFRNNVSYFGVDADQLFKRRPRLAAKVYREVTALFEDGELSALPFRSFPMEDVVEAFRHLQTSRHIGKVVVSMGPGPAPEGRSATALQAAPQPEGPSWSLDPEGTYLVVGGTGGFGLEVARWLSAKGAQSLVLVSRSGASTPEAQAALDELAAAGTKVRVARADASDHDALEGVVSKINGSDPPLRGVVHAAMVLEDATVENIDRDQLQRVLAPKVLGARNLDLLTRRHPLDFFVLFSSATTAFGNPGQAAYVAANAYLEGLAQARRAEGLPALAVGWGAITDVGILARDQEVRDHLIERVGDAGMTSAEALEELERLLGMGVAEASVCRVDWARLHRLLGLGRSTRYRDLIRRHGGARSDHEGGLPLGERLADMAPEDRQDAVLELLRTRVSEILQWPVDRIDPDQQTLELGLDSLMAVELRTALEQEFDFPLSPTLLSRASTLRGMAQILVDRAMSKGAGSEATEDPLEVRERIASHGFEVEDLPGDPEASPEADSAAPTPEASVPASDAPKASESEPAAAGT